MSRKAHFVVLLVVALVLTLAACAPTPTPAPAAPTKAAAPTTAPAAPTKAPAPAAKVNLTYAIWNAAQKPAMDAIIAAFQAKNPNITVEVQVVPFAEYWTKLQTAVAGGSAFDVFWMNGPNFLTYASRGVLLDLEPHLAGVDKNAFPKSLIDLYSYKGHLYGIPKDFDTIGLFYNKALFDAAKVPYPTADWTWDDLRQAAKKLTIKEGNTVKQWGFNATPNAQQVYLNFIFQNGGKLLNEDGTKALIDDPATCEAILFLYDMMKDGSTPTAAEMQANSNWAPIGNLFPAGKIAMITSGSWQSKPLIDANPNIDVAPLPKGKVRATVIHGLGNVVWAKSPHQAEAIEFVKFLGSKEAQQIQGQQGTVIPAMNGLQDTWVKSIPQMKLQVFMDAISYSVPFPTTPKGAAWLDEVDKNLREGWLGNIPRDQICKKTADAANAVLAK